MTKFSNASHRTYTALNRAQSQGRQPYKTRTTETNGTNNQSNNDIT